MEGQTNNKEPTLVDIMASLCNITNSIKGNEQRLGKLEIISNKVDEPETKQNTLKKWFKEVESAQDFICHKFDEQEKQIAKITQENKDLQKESKLLNKMIKRMDLSKKQKGMHWDNMADGKCCRLLVYPMKIVKTALILFTNYVN